MAWNVAHENKRAYTLRAKCQHCGTELEYIRRADNPRAIQFPATLAPHECKKRAKKSKPVYVNSNLGRMG